MSRFNVVLLRAVAVLVDSHSSRCLSCIGSILLRVLHTVLRALRTRHRRQRSVFTVISFFTALIYFGRFSFVALFRTAVLPEFASVQPEQPGLQPLESCVLAVVARGSFFFSFVLRRNVLSRGAVFLTGSHSSRRFSRNPVLSELAGVQSIFAGIFTQLASL